LPATRPIALRAWLGAAVAIKDPTDAVFRPQGGSNLLIVGQQDELALGILSSSVLSLAAQLGPIGGPASLVPRAADSAAPLPRFFILDGARPDAPEAGFWSGFALQVPAGASVISLRDGAKAVGEVADEVNRRLAAGEHAAEPIFLLIHNLARFRDLKKGDEYNFDDEGSANAGKQLTTILREGPSVGIHTLVWCDSYNNVNRWLDRQALRDFEMRVLFQMSATDSSNLMDSPAASRLGGHTAMFYSEERGQAEKFRPYGPPSQQWMQWATEKLRNRAAGDLDKATQVTAVSMWQHTKEGRRE
jgi:DNA segregation ATPase FtsK/SpoIIIE, S-DNA-T family